MGDGGRGKRRAGRLVLAAGVVLLASSIDVGARAAADPGFGKAQAQLLMLDPRSAQLSFGVRFGPTVADHRNTVARAQAQSTDYGLIGGAITGDNCDTGEKAAIGREDLPQPMRADSRTPGDGDERTVSEGPITQSVRADERPSARATSRLVEADLPGIASVRGATNSTSSGVDQDGNPLVTATVDIAQIDLLGGAVRLGPLHWEATNGGPKGPTGKFTLGEATIGGVPIPSQDASVVFEAVNNVLSQVGIVVIPPTTHLETDTIFVDPIKIGVAPNQLRDQVSGAVIAAIQPIREQLFQALIDASCSSGGAITVIDILLGSVTGGGSFTAVLGGAQAQFVKTSGGVQLGGGSGGAPGGPVLGGSTGGSTGGAFAPLPTGAGSGSTGGPGGSTGGTGGTGVSVPAVAAADVADASDGAAPVALGVLALGALLVEADRRKMRQAGVAATPSSPTEDLSG